MAVIPGVPEMTAAMFGDADLHRTAPTIAGPLDEPARAEVYPLPRLIEDARRYLASRSYDSEERMVLRWCVDALEKHTTQPPEHAWPDIGTDPMKGDRSDRYTAAAAACRAAYVKQQPHVPDQTALVWRWHLGALLEEHLRLNVLLSRGEDAQPPERATTGAGEVSLHEAAADLLTAYDAGAHFVCRIDLWERLRAILAALPAPATAATGAGAEMRLVSHKVDVDCGCPEEEWDTPWGVLHMHLSDHTASNGHLDNGDEGERQIEVTAATADEARAAIFAWAAYPNAALPAPATDQAAEVARREEIYAQIINTPETADFMAGVPLEATHQRERWGSKHDAGKTPFDWFWLVGYLAQKAATSAVAGDTEKAKHHTISTAAALANWHAQLLGASDMRPGIGPGNGGDKLGSAFDLASKLDAALAPQPAATAPDVGEG